VKLLGRLPADGHIRVPPLDVAIQHEHLENHLHFCIILPRDAPVDQGHFKWYHYGMENTPDIAGSPPLPSTTTQVVSPSITASSLWHPIPIVFVSNVCIMVLELVAGRIIAPYVGVSLYTWTSVIGVILAGISLGNYLGGWLADRWAALRLLGIIFLLGGLSAFLILLTEGLGYQLPANWPMIIQIVVLTAALFFPPSTILGAVSPVVVKLAVRDLSRTGRTVGRIYAAGTAGSIVGTFVTGFVLISTFGTHAIVWGVGLILITMGVLFLIGGTGSRRQQIGLLAGLIVVGGIGTISAWQGAWNSQCLRETQYFCIKVRDEEHEGEAVRALILDRLVHSFTSLNDPARLIYGYEKIYAEATAYAAARHSPLRALFIGGGGYTFPKYMEATYPDSELDVVEIDPGVTETAYDQLGLARDTRIVSHNEDARLFLMRPVADRYTLIMGDAFNDYSVPYHLTTREFNELARKWLTPGGLYLVNLIDGMQHDFLRAYVHTLRQTFDHVYVAPASENWRASPRMTFVLIATDKALDFAQFKPAMPGEKTALTPQRVLNDAEVQALLNETQPALLTDQFAPVDQMLAPVARGE
jgi:spermidine synthase